MGEEQGTMENEQGKVCCKCKEYRWADRNKQEVVYIDEQGEHGEKGAGYCLFHAPAGCKFKKLGTTEEVSREEFNELVLARIEAVKKRVKEENLKPDEKKAKCNLSGTIFPWDIAFPRGYKFPAIDFSFSTFQGDARFDSSTFQGDARFWQSTFQGHAGFLGSTFQGHAGFLGSTFQGDARFDSSTFKGNARFWQSTFQGHAGFLGSTFQGDAGFLGSTFQGDARFIDSTFQGDAVFNNSTFKGDARFDSSTFQRNAGFDYSTFQKDAWFRQSTVQGDARFWQSTFQGDAGFDSSTFKGEAKFWESTFQGDARFNDSTFQGDAQFWESTFQGDARFNDSTFQGDAQFWKSTFQRDAKFWESTFQGDADFSGSTFQGDARFNDSTFEKKAYFSNIQKFNNKSFVFADNTISGDITFENCDPACLNIMGHSDCSKFYFKKGTRLEKTCEFYQEMKARYKNAGNEYEVSQWHISEKNTLLKILWQDFLGINNTYRTGKFGWDLFLERCRNIAKRVFSISWLLNKLLLFLRIVLLFFYKIFSGFGENPLAALFWLLVFIAIPTVITNLPKETHEQYIPYNLFCGETRDYIPLMNQFLSKKQAVNINVFNPVCAADLHEVINKAFAKNSNTSSSVLQSFGRTAWQLLIYIQAALLAFAVRNNFRR